MSCARLFVCVCVRESCRCISDACRLQNIRTAFYENANPNSWQFHILARLCAIIENRNFTFSSAFEPPPRIASYTPAKRHCVLHIVKC